MNTYSGFLFEGLNIKANAIVEKVSFSGLRGGCIKIYEGVSFIWIKNCFFLECSIMGFGGGIEINGSNLVAEVSSCVASSCFTSPINNELFEGQFAYFSSLGESGSISFLDSWVSLCAPFVFSPTQYSQNIPVYAHYGCKSFKGTNYSRNKAAHYAMYAYTETEFEFSFNTIFGCEVGCKVLHSLGSHTYSHCAFVNNSALIDQIGIYFGMSIIANDCSFIFNSGHKSYVESGTSTFNRCYVVNLNTEGITEKNPVSKIHENQHSGVNFMLKEIFGKGTTRNFRRVKIITSFAILKFIS